MVGHKLTSHHNGTFKKLIGSWQLYLMLLLPLMWFIIFCYAPMYGVTIAFKDFKISKGILGSPWIGLANFEKFFGSFQFSKLLRNTITLSVYELAAGMTFDLLLAIALHYCDFGRFKKFAQTVTYAPHFISTVVMVGMIIQFLHPKVGILNQVIQMLGSQPKSFMSMPSAFPHIYVFSGIWQHAGWGSIIYLSALVGVDPTLHEAAIMDGATKFKRMLHVDFPSILPTIVITMILNIGGVVGVGFEKVYLLQNDLNLATSEVIATYVYKTGIISKLPNYAYAAAIGLFESVVGIVLIVLANFIAKRATDTNLW